MRFIREDNPSRIWELDFARGIALVLMVYFHTIFDLADIYGFKISYTNGIIFYLGKVSVILFIFVAGISSTLSKNNIKRGAQIFVIAMIITVVTHLVDDKLGVKFGILHFLGICMLLYPFISKLSNKVLFVSGIIIIIVGNYFTNIVASNDFLFIFNLTSNNFYSSDYYPLLPWMGIYLFGIAIGRLVYSERKSIFQRKIKDNIILMVGRNTLLIYILHQPIILAGMTILFKLSKLS